MVWRLRSALQYAQLAAGIEGGVRYQFEQRGFAQVMRARTRHQYSAWAKQTEGAQVDLFIPAHSALQVAARLRERRGIEHYRRELASRRRVTREDLENIRLAKFNIGDCVCFAVFFRDGERRGTRVHGFHRL